MNPKEASKHPWVLGEEVGSARASATEADLVDSMRDTMSLSATTAPIPRVVKLAADDTGALPSSAHGRPGSGAPASARLGNFFSRHKTGGAAPTQ
jgi:hypothetical protein